ncbi:EAL domain-containing protein [candidate division CSSED10-310 bacterium]|uniref:EAL domain-containing protein n=1 Tax=candidate division CSSED10-310 bacterium TaxID=2855610 RepID=A0ABV6Z6J6_UNCC1
MGSQLKVLIISDSEADGLLIQKHVQQAGYDLCLARVDQLKSMVRALEQQTFDIIISEYSLPGMDALEALRLLKEKKIEAPFVIISRCASPEKIVQAMKAGADDYITTDHLDRLIPVLDRELHTRERQRRLVQGENSLRMSEEQYRTLIEQASDGIFIIDNEANVLDANPAGCALLNYTKAELLTMKFTDAITPQELREKPLQLETMKTGKTFMVERNLIRKNGTLVPVEISAKKLLEGLIQGIVRDISTRKKAAEALRESEERYALAARGANDGLWDWNLKDVEIYFSPRWKSMLGYQEDEISSSPDEWFERAHPDDIARLKTELLAHFHGRSPHFECEYRIKHKDNTYRWVLTKGLAFRNKEGGATRIAGSQTDIHDRKMAEQQLLYDAFHDTLTGLPNRALFTDRLGQSIQRVIRYADYHFAVLVLDLDRFKVINDSLGHTLGDKLLVEIADRLKLCLRQVDTIAYLGGDEYALLLDDIHDDGDATRIAERIQNALKSPITLNKHELVTTVSIGITTDTSSYKNPDYYLRDADIAMYRAKAAGGARYVIFDEKMHSRAMGLLQLETDLRLAYERQEFLIYYQPIIDLKTGYLVSFEALLRWQHPRRGLVMPADFITNADDTGLLIFLDRWVMKEASSQLKRWQEHYSLPQQLSMNVNLTSKQFSKTDFLDYVADILKSTKIDPQCLQLEIVESTIMEKNEHTNTLLSQLKSLGLKLSIDDFGMGYSSLSYLHQFPIDTLKIDRSFLKQMSLQDNKSEIVVTIISLAHNLGMDVMAEGVESEKHLHHLRALDCDYAQGFYISKPLNAQDAEKFMMEYRRF